MRRRTRQSDLIQVEGFTVEIKPMEEMGYDGKWESDGFDLYLGQKHIKSFIGYPTKQDILNELKNEGIYSNV